MPINPRTDREPDEHTQQSVRIVLVESGSVLAAGGGGGGGGRVHRQDRDKEVRPIPCRVEPVAGYSVSINLSHHVDGGEEVCMRVCCTSLRQLLKRRFR